MTQVGTITFPEYSGVRCLMMPYIQGDPDSVPDHYDAYRPIIKSTYLAEGEIGFLTIDESPVTKGSAHRGAHAAHGRAVHTEAGLLPESGQFMWGGGSWGGRANVILDRDLQVLLANNLADSCALWDAVHLDTSLDGDIGDQAHLYPYKDATLMQPGEVHRIGILTPHESMPVETDFDRQFLRIIGSGVRGREPYFTVNPLLSA